MSWADTCQQARLFAPGSLLSSRERLCGEASCRLGGSVQVCAAPASEGTVGICLENGSSRVVGAGGAAVLGSRLQSQRAQVQTPHCHSATRQPRASTLTSYPIQTHVRDRFPIEWPNPHPSERATSGEGETAGTPRDTWFHTQCVCGKFTVTALGVGPHELSRHLRVTQRHFHSHIY